MKSTGAYLFAAAALALGGAICLWAGWLDRDMARAQQSVAAMNYVEADRIFADAERYYDYASHLPWVGNGPVNDLRARRAMLQYWQGQYAAIPLEQPADNIALQLVAANAVYRGGRSQAKDRQGVLQAVNDGIEAYVGVLKNAARQHDAAYNYEYLVRLREDILGGRANLKITAPFDPNGSSGILLEGGDTEKFRIYIPLSPEEEKGGGAGKIGPVKRKG